ncbi:hypothetical protein ACHHYP_02995 [Achlya hypogyna]|uniref:FYVE-type domain-containing protein n=1 Tax=Achlya hypogyna TaxID=1202772 RepID=A0A1V9Z4Z4_ACHHY|nr:hypothetical protein ACHHYP_02995 [Achlya hypogyna]
MTQAMSGSLADALSRLPPLDPMEVKFFLNHIDAAVDDALLLCNDLGAIRWTPSRQKDGVVVSRAADDMNSMSNHALAVRSVCLVNASFDEMLDHLTTETTHDFHQKEMAVNPAEFLDGAVLHVLCPRDVNGRFVCIKWHCMKSVAPPTKPRDYVYIEIVDSFVNEDSHRIGYRLSKSIDMDSLRSVDGTTKFVRATTTMLHTFRTNESATRVSSPKTLSDFQVELRSMVLGDYNGKLPMWVTNKMSELAGLRGAALRDHFDQSRMNTLKWIQPHEFVPTSKRSFCSLCTRQFSLVRKKYNCRACGDVICSQCSMNQQVGPREKAKIRVCGRCNLSARTNQLPTGRHSGSGRDSAPRDSVQFRDSTFRDSSYRDSQFRDSQAGNFSFATTRVSEKYSMDRSSNASDWSSSSARELQYAHSLGPSQGPHSTPTHYRRSHSEMPPTHNGTSPPDASALSRASQDSRPSMMEHRMLAASMNSTGTPRTMSITSNSSSRPSINDASRPPTIPRISVEDMQHISIVEPPKVMLPPAVTSSPARSSLGPEQFVDMAMAGLDFSIVQTEPTASDSVDGESDRLSDLSSASEVYTERYSERMSERMSERISELDVDAYDDADQSPVFEEEISLDDLSPAIKSPTSLIDLAKANMDDVNYVRESFALHYDRESFAMGYDDLDKDRSSIRSTVNVDNDEDESLQRMTLVMKLNADMDAITRDISSVKESTVELHQRNQEVTEKIQDIGQHEHQRQSVDTPPEAITPEPSITAQHEERLTNALSKINKELFMIQTNMEIVRESTKAIDAKLVETEPLAPTDSSREGFVSFLKADSFEVNPDVATTENGWAAVQSTVTGKAYYYNVSCGKTSWTLPQDDDSYMVL